MNEKKELEKLEADRLEYDIFLRLQGLVSGYIEMVFGVGDDLRYVMAKEGMFDEDICKTIIKDYKEKLEKMKPFLNAKENFNFVWQCANIKEKKELLQNIETMMPDFFVKKYNKGK